jgi:hypothetical protein
MSDFRINDLELVSLTVASWNLIGEFLRRLDVTEKTGLIAVSCTLACALLVHHQECARQNGFRVIFGIPRPLVDCRSSFLGQRRQLKNRAVFCRAGS